MPPADQVRALADRLNAASTVTLFCGAGVRGAHDEVMALADKVASPVGHSLRGKEWIQYDNPYDVGMSGLLGYGACYEATHRPTCWSCSAPTSPTTPSCPQRRTVQVDHDLDPVRPADAARSGGPRRRRRHPRRGAAAGGAEAGPLVPRRHAARPHARARAGRRRLHPRHRAPSPDPSRVRGQHPRRGGRRGRRLHRGHRHVQRVGGALHHAERPAARHRVVPARDDGQRAAARDRRPVRVPGPAGHLDVRRRRARDAARRAAHGAPSTACR